MSRDVQVDVALQPLVSVLVTAYNAAHTLGECLDSVRSQTHQNLDVVVVDDGSTDDTLRIAENLASRDPRFRVFTQPNRGCPVACNAALERARGDVLFRLDSDDILMPGYVREMLGIAATNPEFDAYASNGWYLGPADGMPVYPTRGGRVTVGARQLLAGRRIPYNALFKRTYLDLVGGFDPELRHGEDFDFWLRGSLRGAVFLFDPRPRWRYRRVGVGKSYAIGAESRAELEILQHASEVTGSVIGGLSRAMEGALRVARADVVRRGLEHDLLDGGVASAPRRRFLGSYAAYRKPWAFWLALPLVIASPAAYAKMISRRRHTATYRT
jgi:hypothetical protein